ncbi:Os08g0215400 [Oryza sativa Japonica Group]|uniref:Os08g0215400 protein n=2 Tax=Oryza TaxID=4527 RepID=A0A0P0XD42_ORYSJ|nr:hypothetical protein EE612_042774 [Oryza sativa]KAF2918600.1 hypothetical protein DAI22_08g069400 [Oryza sativa Japonica Group]BAT04344.1 Os08g0215400 [Oryza sativa Japonica Group]
MRSTQVSAPSRNEDHATPCALDKPLAISGCMRGLLPQWCPRPQAGQGEWMASSPPSSNRLLLCAVVRRRGRPAIGRACALATPFPSSSAVTRPPTGYPS